MKSIDNLFRKAAEVEYRNVMLLASLSFLLLTQRVDSARYIVAPFGEDPKPDKPKQTSILYQIQPNPLKESEIMYIIPSQAQVNLSVYDISGRLVRTLVNEEEKAGNYKVKWNGTDNKGKLLPNGIYFSRLKVSDFTTTKKVVLMR